MAYLIKKLSKRLVFLLLFALMAAVPCGYASNGPPQQADADQDTEFATMISEVSSEIGSQHALVRIAASGAIRDYTYFTLTDPPRIVYDLKNVGSPHDSEQTLAVDSPWIERVRYYTYPDKVRLVVETSPDNLSAHTASPTQNGLTIEVGESVRAASPKAPVYLASAGPASDADSPRTDAATIGLVNRIDFTSETDGKSTILIGATETPDYTLEKMADTQLKLTLFNTKLPDYRERPLITTGFESAVDRVVPYTDAGVPDQTFFTIEMRESVPYYVEQKGEMLMVHFEASSIPAKAPAAELTLADQKVVVEKQAARPQSVATAAPAMTARAAASVQPVETPAIPEETGPNYTGEKIALDFYETDIKNVFRILQTVSGLNFAIDRDVTGQVTLSFDEPVPWDQVLDLILKMNQLDKKMEGNIVRIATLSTLKKEESERQAAMLAEQKSKEQELALEPLRTEYIAVNYSNAGSEVLPHIKNILTEGRGSANVDERNNLIVITDTDRVIAQAKTIVRRLDRVTPQVVIEARVVEVNSDVSSELGIRWSGGQESVYKNMLGGTYGWDVAMNYPSEANSVIGFEFARVSGTPFVLDAQLNALESESRGKIISAPKIMTMDNKKATIKQGVEVGYLERDDSGGSSVAFKSVDLLLEVTPHVTPDERVSITLYITKNDISGYAEDGTPALSTNEAETEFLVNDGETIVIGGILKKSETNDYSGFPVLRDIPGLGWLFKEKKEVTASQELLIFITPKIVTLEQKVEE